ncbi:glycosyl hydrolase family 43 [Striga asiatica]|uniref:Glycosyl hydrolase family 43 n=1 Tax=Striga asiatica TaxID=4170 RepID=A0A5A7QS83_STRAF|nr:glycosyl hydrolase family 43 [Striga asiatica]
MALWLAKSRNTITNFLKTKTFYFHEIALNNNQGCRGINFWFHANSASYKTLAVGFSRNPCGSRVESTAFRVFRRPESARAGEQVEAVAYTDYVDSDNDEDDENQMLCIHDSL